MKIRHLITVLLLSTAMLADTKTYSPDVVYAKAKTAVVTIWTFDSNRAPLSQGSGFIVARNRVATNYHVLAGSTIASVTFQDGSMATIKAVTAASEPKDLAIVEVETGARPALTLGDELQLKVGDTVYAIGAPKGLAASLSSGLVSAFRQDEGQFVLQVTAPIAPGSSGGPLLNAQGQVVGVTTSRLNDGGFGFAMGAGDLQHLLKVPLSVRLDLSDLVSSETAATAKSDMSSIKALLDQKKYEEASTQFGLLPEKLKGTFDGKLLLCRLSESKKDFKQAVQVCDEAIRSKPDESLPYGLKAFALLSLGEIDGAEAPAAKAVSLSDDDYYKTILGVIHYSQEKYMSVQKDLPATSNDPFVLSLMAGAAFHNRDFETFRQLRDKLLGIKGESNGWSLFAEGLAAERDLKWDVAIDKYKQCDVDVDFIDPICVVALIRAESEKGDPEAARNDVSNAVAHYPRNSSVLEEGIFIYLMDAKFSEAARLHDILTAEGKAEESTECLYYYGTNQAAAARTHCEAAIRGHESVYGVWSNAGYAAIDVGDFSTARSYFAKAVQLFYDSKDKHTITQELDVLWGATIASYFYGDKKDARTVYKAIKKTYPAFLATSSLKQLPLVWSDRTLALITTICSDYR